MNLNEIKTGGSATVRQMELPAATRMRLKALGMTNGTMVRVLHRKASGSMILSVRGTRLALGGSITGAVQVERLEKRTPACPGGFGGAARTGGPDERTPACPGGFGGGATGAVRSGGGK